MQKINQHRVDPPVLLVLLEQKQEVPFALDPHRLSSGVNLK